MPLEKEFGHGPQPSLRLEQQQPYRNVGRVQGCGVEGGQGLGRWGVFGFQVFGGAFIALRSVSPLTQSALRNGLSSIVIPDVKLIDFHSF